MIPIFIIIVSVPMDWGTISFGDTTLAVTQLVGAIIFAVASFTDWLDGKIARAQGLVTNFGKFADPLVGQGKVPAWIVAIIVCRELAVTGLRLLLVEHGEVMAAAWPGKVKTATQMVAIILLFINNIPFSALHLPLDQIMLYACLIFTIYSGVDYFAKNKDVFKGSM